MCDVNNLSIIGLCRVPPLASLPSNSSVVNQAFTPSSLASLSARFKVDWQGVDIVEATVVRRFLALTNFILASHSSMANFKDKIVRHDVGGRTLVGCSMAIRINLSEMLKLGLGVNHVVQIFIWGLTKSM